MHVLNQVEAILQEQLSDVLHFTQERPAQTLAYGGMQRIAFITIEFALVKLAWAFTTGKVYIRIFTHSSHLNLCSRLWEGIDLNI